MLMQFQVKLVHYVLPLQARPHIDSFRTRGNKGASFKNYESDRVPRRGPKYQHGIYEPAQS